MTLFVTVNSFAGRNKIKPTPKSSDCKQLVSQSPTEEVTTQFAKDTENKILTAMRKDFQQRYSSEPIKQLRQMGVSSEQLSLLTRPAIEKALSELSAKEASPLLSNGIQNLHIEDTNLLKPNFSIAEFAFHHKLETERIAVTKILNYRDQDRGDSQKAHETLKIAILSGQKDLAKEAFLQCLRYNNLRELSDLAVEINDEQILMQIGRLAIARFVFFDRNQNYLHDGLRALVEINGELKSQAVQLLIDFSDLIASEKILENEKQVNTFGEKNDRKTYNNNALEVLLAAGNLVGRVQDDSVSYHYIVESDDARLTKRIKNLMATFHKTRSYPDVVDILSALHLVNDIEYLKQQSELFYKFRFQFPDFVREVNRPKWTASQMQKSLKIALMTNDRTFIEQQLNTLLTNPKEAKLSDMSYYDEKIYLPQSALDILKEILSARLSNKNLDGNQKEHIEGALKKLKRDMANKAKMQISLEREGMFLWKENFSHHIQIIEYALQNESGIKGSWGDFLNAIHRRDKEALINVYNDMLENGRALDAVYAAFAISVIENNGDLSTLRALGNSQLQLTHQN